MLTEPQAGSTVTDWQTLSQTPCVLRKAIRRSASDRFRIVQSGTGSLVWVDLNGDGG
ncbi:hypothetical protein [Brevundimonas sp.]|uniref:hypothetical protein n=1 Tax=Brevundimonas sp. TaxID=1871086 RepID=UPI0037849306